MYNSAKELNPFLSSTISKFLSFNEGKSFRASIIGTKEKAFITVSSAILLYYYSFIEGKSVCNVFHLKCTKRNNYLHWQTLAWQYCAVYDRRMQIIIFKLKQRELLKLSSAKSDLIRKQNASCMMKEFRTALTMEGASQNKSSRGSPMYTCNQSVESFEVWMIDGSKVSLFATKS